MQNVVFRELALISVPSSCLV